MVLKCSIPTNHKTNIQTVAEYLIASFKHAYNGICWEDHLQVLNGEDKGHKTNTSVQFNGDRATDVTRLLLVKCHVIGTYGRQLIW